MRKRISYCPQVMGFVLLCIKLFSLLVFSRSLKVSFCFWSRSSSSQKTFSLKLEMNCSAGMWEVQEYQAWATGHFDPSLSVLILSVSYETSYTIMDFFEEWPERKVNSVCFPNIVTYYQTISLLITLINRSDEISWKNCFKYWLEMYLVKVIKGFWKRIPLGSSNSLFWGLLLTCPGCLQLQFLTWFSQHMGQVLITAEKKTKILTPGPQKRRVVEFIIESVFSESQLCVHYPFLWGKKYLHHY